MTILTAKGSFAQAYLQQFEAEVASFLDLGESAFIEKLSTAQVVIHNASTINCGELDHCLTRNFDFTRYLVRVLEEHNPTAHLIFLSSMSILDPGNDQTYGDPLAMTPYAYSKYLAETYALKSPLAQISVVRFSTLFYQDPTKDGLSKLIHDAVTTDKITIYDHGQARRNFLPITIAAQYVHKLSQISPVAKRTYNLAAEHSSSFQDVVTHMQKELPTLSIDDQPGSTSTMILSEFTDADVRSLGVIPFSLEEEISRYLRSLQK